MRITDLSAFSAAKRPPHIVGARWESTASGVAGRAQPPRCDSTTGTVRLRCLTPTDAHHMKDLLERLSPHSRYLRYLRLVRSFTPAEIAKFVADGPDHLAVGAFDGDLLVGAAQYFRASQCPDRAEIAVEVADSHQRHGLGAQLVRELALLAATDGITHFTATVLAQNRAVLGLMRHSGWRILTAEDGPYVDVVVTLPPELVGDEARGGPGCPAA
jgi:GNAT superfamily N-acetyltransferase